MRHFTLPVSMSGKILIRRTADPNKKGTRQVGKASPPSPAGINKSNKAGRVQVKFNGKKNTGLNTGLQSLRWKKEGGGA